MLRRILVGSFKNRGKASMMDTFATINHSTLVAYIEAISLIYTH